MFTAVAFVAMAGLGALARAEIGQRYNRHDGFPAGTLLVNCSGSFLLGLLAGASSPVVTVFGVGFLGAYTTVSSFARDGVALLETGKQVMAAVYVFVSLFGSFACALLGLMW